MLGGTGIGKIRAFQIQLDRCLHLLHHRRHWRGLPQIRIKIELGNNLDQVRRRRDPGMNLFDTLIDEGLDRRIEIGRTRRHDVLWDIRLFDLNSADRTIFWRPQKGKGQRRRHDRRGGEEIGNLMATPDR